jgi:hypothetical protein
MKTKQDRGGWPRGPSDAAKAIAAPGDPTLTAPGLSHLGAVGVGSNITAVHVHEAAHAVLSSPYVEHVTMSPPHVQRTELPGDRDHIEAAIVSALSGSIAERYVAPSTGYIEDTEDDGHAQWLAESLAKMSAPGRELLQSAAALPDEPTDVASDETQAFALSYALVQDEARAHVAWLSQVARRRVIEEWESIVAVARALERHGSLSGPDVAAIIEATAGHDPALAETE